MSGRVPQTAAVAPQRHPARVSTRQQGNDRRGGAPQHGPECGIPNAISALRCNRLSGRFEDVWKRRAQAGLAA
jgi:hypothetical protein